MAWGIIRPVLQGLNKAKKFVKKPQTASGGSGGKIPPKQPTATATPEPPQRGPSLLHGLESLPPETKAAQATEAAVDATKKIGLRQKAKAGGKFVKDVSKAGWNAVGGLKGLTKGATAMAIVDQGLVTPFENAYKRVQGDTSEASAIHGLGTMIDAAGQQIGRMIPGHENFGKKIDTKAQEQKGFDELSRASLDTIYNNIPIIETPNQYEARMTEERAAADQRIADYKAGKLTGEQALVNQPKKETPKSQEWHDKMPVPQVNTLTPEQVTQVTNGSDDVGKWRPGPDGSGVIKRSDGTYTHVRPYTQEEQAARDRQYNDHINDQVNQYMLDYLSKANSSLYSPRERAIYADLALGLRSVMGGGAGGSGAGSASGLQAMKFAAAQDAQAQKNLSDSLTREEARIEKDNKDNPVMRDIALNNLKTNNGLRSVNPHDALAIREAEARAQRDEMINRRIYEATGDPSFDYRDMRMDTPGWAHPINQVASFFTNEPFIKPRPVINTGGMFEPTTIDLSKMPKEVTAQGVVTALKNSGYSDEHIQRYLLTGKLPWDF